MVLDNWYMALDSWHSVIASAIAPAHATPSIVLSGVLLSLIVVFFASKLGGELCARVNLPTVLGELVGGVSVGISALHLLVFPSSSMGAAGSQIMQLIQGTAHLNPAALQANFLAQSEVISTLAELGVVMLLLEIGLESDLNELIKVGAQATVVAAVGVTVPFILGTAGLMLIFHVPAIAAIFAGAALTATSIGITAKVLTELQRLSSREGQIILGAAVLDDILGIIVLAVVGGLIKTGELEVGHIVSLSLSAGGFLIGGIVLGRWFGPFFVTIVNQLKTRGSLLSSALIFAFILSYVAVVIKLEAILGAFVAGLVLAETEKREELMAQIKPIADMLVPIFFVVVGARTDVSVLNPLNPANHEGLIIAAFLFAVAVLGKLVTGLAVFGQPGINRWAIGIGMIPRGEVGLVFAAYGASTGALSAALQVAVVVMVVLTTTIAPPLLRVAFNHLPPDQRED
jgi:Kef-type K+ transport system membrane component KefB